MNKQEMAAVALLFLLLFGWGYYQSRHRPPAPPAGTAPTPGEQTNAVGSPPAAELAPSEPARIRPAAASTQTVAVTHSAPERTAVLQGELARVTVSSWGGGIVSVELPQYPEQIDGEEPVMLDFSALPALSLTGIASLSTNADYRLASEADGRRIRLDAAAEAGLRLTRTVELLDGYRLQVTDLFVNPTDKPLLLPEHAVRIGPMSSIRTRAQMRGMSYLGLDTLQRHGGDKVRHWGKKLSSLFGLSSSRFSCARPNPVGMPSRAKRLLQSPTAWAAVKNKFFVQLLAPDDGCDDCELQAFRDMSSSNQFAVGSVAASLLYEARTLQPGESWTRPMSYYVGPKKYARLKQLGAHQGEVMEFGLFKPLCNLLLMTLNGIYGLIPNYGVAIILLTALVRILFWPVTHKSTESMKKMQAIQPLVNEVRKKYKDKPQKMNQEVMALYKEHKVNPMAGCLPMLVQIPVFIALFTVLRSAVELRFAGFLWISDLSEPEGLLAGVLPFPASGLNILPLFMTATMIWQQKLTPSAGDSQQQKMMAMMPLVMLFIFYGMASALVLYWSTSQCLSIAQLLLQRRRSATTSGDG